MRIDHVWTYVCGLDRFMVVLLLGATSFSVTLVVLLWTRWGHSRSLEKCVLLSILAHALLTGYAATVQIANFRSPPREQFVHIALVDGPAGRRSASPALPTLQQAPNRKSLRRFQQFPPRRTDRRQRQVPRRPTPHPRSHRLQKPPRRSRRNGQWPSHQQTCDNWRPQP